MPNGFEARQIRAIFFPEHKRHTFHRINMEYLASLKAMRRETIHSLLQRGLQGNLRNVGGSHEVIHSLRPQLETVARQINVQSSRLQQDRASLRQQLVQKSREGFSVYRAEMEVDFANRKLSASFALQSTQAHDHVLTAVHMLKDALYVNHRNYQAHFELGWMYLFLLRQPEQAEFHLNCAARMAREDSNSRFAVFALRHLADARYSLNQPEAAAQTALDVVNIQQTQKESADQEHLYECARYLAAAGEVREATRHLAALVTQTPVYYVQAQMEPDFSHDDIRGMLYDLRQIRVRRIRHYVHTTWQNHQLARLPLPDSIDPNQLFRQTFQRHVRVMGHLPYDTLSQRESQIGELIVHESRQRVLKEIRQRSRQYENVTELKRHRWAWVNRLGGLMIHTSAVLLLASVLFFVTRYVANIAGMGAFLSADSLVHMMVVVMLILLVAGVALVQFVPLGSRKLLRKQIELDNTLKLLDVP